VKKNKLKKILTTLAVAVALTMPMKERMEMKRQNITHYV